jgi:hypothetical protein
MQHVQGNKTCMCSGCREARWLHPPIDPRAAVYPDRGAREKRGFAPRPEIAPDDHCSMGEHFQIDPAGAAKLYQQILAARGRGGRER